MNINRFLPYGKQNLDESDIKSVVDVLKGDWITQGPKINEFEEKLAEFVGAKYAVACSNGTAALHIACQAIGLSSGGKLVTSPNTFLASANCAQFVGADSLFVDIDPDTFNISIKKLKELLEKEKIDVVVPVDFAGQSCDMQEIYKLKEKYGFYIIEDSCHALGGEYLNNKVGSCSFADLSIFSFHPVKHITTGEGGAVTTNNRKFYEKLLIFRNHGMHKNPNMFLNKNLAFDEYKNPNVWYYEMFEIGHNYRITDIQCALGISQLEKIEKFVAGRQRIARKYNQAFAENIFIKTPLERKGIKSAYHLYVLQVDFKKINKSRNLVMKELRKVNVGTQVLYIPVHLQPYYSKKYGYKMGNFPVAENYYQHCLAIPMFQSLTDKEVDHVALEINKIVSI